jgi:hypothetical protein
LHGYCRAIKKPRIPGIVSGVLVSNPLQTPESERKQTRPLKNHFVTTKNSLYDAIKQGAFSKKQVIQRSQTAEKSAPIQNEINFFQIRTYVNPA